MKEYILTSTVYNTKKEHIFYGVSLIDRSNGMYELIKEFNGLLENKNIVEKLVNDCNNLQLDESQLLYVVEDLISQ